MHMLSRALYIAHMPKCVVFEALVVDQRNAVNKPAMGIRINLKYNNTRSDKLCTTHIICSPL